MPTTVDATGKDATTTTAPAPITGYGDFSGFGPFEIDRYYTTELLVRCIRDQGFAVEVIPPGDGISFTAVPVDQNQAAVDAAEACEAGLGLPELTAAGLHGRDQGADVRVPAGVTPMLDLSRVRHSGTSESRLLR